MRARVHVADVPQGRLEDIWLVERVLGWYQRPRVQNLQSRIRSTKIGVEKIGEAIDKLRSCSQVLAALVIAIVAWEVAVRGVGGVVSRRDTQLEGRCAK